MGGIVLKAPERGEGKREISVISKNSPKATETDFCRLAGIPNHGLELFRPRSMIGSDEANDV